MNERDRAAIAWLAASDEPGIRIQARRDLLGETPTEDSQAALEGPAVRALLAGQQPNGGFGVDVYSKWKGAHWRLGVARLLREKRAPDGRWSVDGPVKWRSAGLRDPARDPAPWPGSGPSEMATLNALRALADFRNL